MKKLVLFVFLLWVFVFGGLIYYHEHVTRPYEAEVNRKYTQERIALEKKVVGHKVTGFTMNESENVYTIHVEGDEDITCYSFSPHSHSLVISFYKDKDKGKK